MIWKSDSSLGMHCKSISALSHLSPKDSDFYAVLRSRVKTLSVNISDISSGHLTPNTGMKTEM